jgi:hypothetical protein
LTGSENSACLATDGALAAANFDTRRRTCAFSLSRSEGIPAYSGATVETHGSTLRYTVALNAQSACLLETVRTLRIDGTVRIDAIADGAIYITNTGDSPAQVDKTLTIAPGETGNYPPIPLPCAGRPNA